MQFGNPVCDVLTSPYTFKALRVLCINTRGKRFNPCICVWVAKPRKSISGWELSFSVQLRFINWGLNNSVFGGLECTIEPARKKVTN